jgi:predicted small integral membrane protein
LAPQSCWRPPEATPGGFQRAKTFAIQGLTFGFLVWQVGFQSIGGECFGMWRSTTWNGEDSAFRDYITILAVLIYVTLPEPDLA